jgi:hypothetical protein
MAVGAFWLTAAVLVLALLMPHRRIAKPVETGLLLSLPALLLTAALGFDGNFGDFRLRVLSFSLEPARLSEPFSIGGDPKRDDFVVAGIASGYARLRRARDGGGFWTFSPEAGSDEQIATAQLVDGEGGGELLGSAELRPGDLVCLEHCSVAGAWLRVSDDGNGFKPRAGAGELPRFKRAPVSTVAGRDIIPGLRWWGPTQAIYPLRDYGLRHAAFAAGDDPCKTRLLCLSDGRPVRSFVYRVGRGANGLRIVLLDPEAVVYRGGALAARFQSRLSAPVGGSTLRLFRVRYGSPYLELNGPGRPASRLEPAVSIAVASDENTVRLTPTGVPVVPIRRSDIERAAAGRPLMLSLTITGAGNEAAGLFQNPLPLPDIGGVSGQGLKAELLLPSEGDYGAAGSEFRLAGRAEPVQLTEPFDLGAEGTGRSVRLRLDRLDRPWLLMVMALLWFPLVLRAALPILQANRIGLLIVAAVHWLLALRILVGAESAFLDPALDVAPILGAAAAAYLTLPVALLAILPASDDLRRGLPGAVMFAAGANVILGWRFGISTGFFLALLLLLPSALAVNWSKIEPILVKPGPRRVIAAIGTAAVLVGVGSAIFWDQTPATVAIGLSGLLAFVLLGFAKPPQSAMARFKRIAYHDYAWFWVLIGVGVLRFGGLLGGVRERIPGPVPFAVSTIYVPVLIFGFACAIVSAARQPAERAWLRAALLSLALLADLVVLPILAGDNGLMIYLMPVLLVTALVTLRKARQSEEKRLRFQTLMAWNLPALGLMLLIACAVLVGQVAGTARAHDLASAVAQARQASNEDERRAASGRVALVLQQINQDDRNVLRLWTAFAPERIALAGTSDAESQKRVVALLADYTDTFWGRGFMARSDPADIRPYQADDNLSSIHLISPFGRTGAALLLLVLGGLAIRCTRDAPLDRIGPVAGSLALWTVFLTALYMILGNLQWVPFTGRNIYLLAALSASDLLEGAILFAIAIRCLSLRDKPS